MDFWMWVPFGLILVFCQMIASHFWGIGRLCRTLDACTKKSDFLREAQREEHELRSQAARQSMDRFNRIIEDFVASEKSKTIVGD